GEAFLVLEVNQPGVEVRVDGERITVSVPGENKPVEIKVAPGRHQLQISKDGFVAVTQNIELRTGQAEPIKVRSEPIPVARAQPVEQVLQPSGPAAQVNGFVPLFNGKDLTGWHVESGDRARWAVEDGAIVGKSSDGLKRNYLLTDRDYDDFT